MVIIRTAVGVILGMIGFASFFGTILMIASEGKNVVEDVGIPVGISVVFITLAMVTAPWLF